FDWSEISPTIFGAVFESTLNPDTRRSGGMHYTSIENIHKVIDPLFMDDLNEEFARISHMPTGKQQRQLVDQFQDKLASLTFLDPACGSGNFLTETYISLRKLENQAIKLKTQGQVLMGLEEVSPIKVSIHQFYGIEINDFAVTVATTALWIAESQMMAQTQDIIQFKNDFLPLKSYANIREGNALRIDWAEVIDSKQLNYIIGNPPFVGYSLQSSAQKEDILSIYLDEKGKPYKTAGKIDYVAGWYWKASQLMANAAAQGHVIRTALVSTNSITQGEQVAAIWKPLYERFGIHIDFAWRTFRWDSESSLKAHVHCVIVGFSAIKNDKQSVLYLGEEVYKKCEIINFYLTEGQILFIESKSKPICNVPTLLNGGKPTEGGYLIMTEEEMLSLVQSNPIAQKWIRPYMMGKDFIERKTRFCLWMVEASPAELRQCNRVMERIENVRNYRLASPKAATRQKADTPMLFDEVRECTTNYVAIPKVSSERRRYIPMEYLPKDIIPGDKLFMLQDATLFHFGILTSNVHMAWMRAICGRLKSDYSYSNTIVYNNFPWPTPTDAQRAKIEQTAQAILNARALYPDSSLADLYDEVTMPPELRKAHQQNDRAVMEAYGFGKDLTENDIVAELLRMYLIFTENQDCV
ncbi:MAG: N-6 DNA methylase, partial [Bacteroidales bacterium]|nr:N-6 DNA methylase [Bacteroidales bacterium]